MIVYFPIFSFLGITHSSPSFIPEWRPAPRQPADPESYLKKLLAHHPEDTYYGQLLRALFNRRGVDMKISVSTSPTAAPAPLAESPIATPKPATSDAAKPQGEKKKSA